jgi:hypothetical protein
MAATLLPTRRTNKPVGGIMTETEIMAYSQDQLFDRDNLLKVFEEESEVDRFFLLDAFVTKSEEFKCKQKMKALISATKKEIDKASRAQKRDANNLTDFGHINGELNCGSWIADGTGIRILTLFGEKLACYHPILPIERLFNIETKTEKITLAYERDHQWKEITVDKGLIASASKIVRLADYGIAVTSESAKDLVKYLSDVENLNDIPLKLSTSKFGWHKEDFIPYDRSVVFDDESRFKELAESLRESGSYDIWLDLCKKVRANKAHYEPQIYMAASFASVLVSKLNMLPFIVNLWGSTGKGKTVALMMAASIWANPAENKYITDSYATQNAFEIRLDILNHLPLLMDDLSKVRDKLNDNFTDLIYLLCSGKGKDRSNVDLGLNKVKTWQNTILSNMERPLATETMKGGAINRILDFEMQDGYIFENGNAVVEILKDNYGFAGIMFVDFVRDLGVEYISKMRKDFEAQIKEEAKKQGSEKEEKQILPMSLLLTADKLATDYIFDDGIYLDLPTMVSQLKDVNEVSEGQRAYDTLIDYTNIYQGKFSSDNEYKPESWGFVKDGYLNIIPSIMRKIAKDENFSVKAFCSWADQKKLLKRNDKSQNKIRIGNQTVRFYSIKIVQDADEKGDTAFREVEQEEIPFD